MVAVTQSRRIRLIVPLIRLQPPACVWRFFLCLSSRGSQVRIAMIVPIAILHLPAQPENSRTSVFFVTGIRISGHFLCF
jgi:hypothetical protein